MTLPIQRFLTFVATDNAFSPYAQIAAGQIAENVQRILNTGELKIEQDAETVYLPEEK